MEERLKDLCAAPFMQHSHGDTELQVQLKHTQTETQAIQNESRTIKELFTKSDHETKQLRKELLTLQTDLQFKREECVRL